MSLTAHARSDDPQELTAVGSDPLLAANELRRDRSARAVQKISALGEMTSGIAHDFRNVLAVVASGLRVARAKRRRPREAGRSTGRDE